MTTLHLRKNTIMPTKKDKTPQAQETKPKRNTRSWKTEAERLKALLVLACTELASERANDDNGDADPPNINNLSYVANWWSAHKTEAIRLEAALKASALGKLTKAERKVLGHEVAP
jgi:hypothetical protein